VGTGNIKSQDRFRFDGGQATNLDFTSLSKYKIQDLTPATRAVPHAKEQQPTVFTKYLIGAGTLGSIPMDKNRNAKAKMI